MAQTVLHVCVGPQGLSLGWTEGGRWLPDRFMELAWPGPRAGERFDELLAGVAKRIEQQGAGGWAADELRVLVCDVLLASAALPWSEVLLDAALAPAMARGQLAHAGHEVDADAVLRVDDAPLGHSRWVVAYPAPLMKAFEALAGTVKGRLHSVLPWSLAAWHSAQPRRLRVLGVWADGVSGLVHASAQGHVLQARLRSAPDARATLLKQWQRHGLDVDLAVDKPDVEPAVPGKLRVFDLRRHRDATVRPGDSQMDAMPEAVNPEEAEFKATPLLRLSASLVSRPRIALDAVQRPGRPGWWALAAALALCLVGAGLAVQTVQEWRTGQALASAWEATRRPFAQAPAPSADWTREERARIAAVNEAVARLNLPANLLLEALLPPADIKISILSVDIKPAPGPGPATSVIQAQARSGQDMARYVAFVASKPPFSAAVLRQHEWLENEAIRPYRFQMEATWSQ